MITEHSKVDIEKAVELAKDKLRERGLDGHGDVAVAILDDTVYVTEWYWRDLDRAWEDQLVAQEGEVHHGTFVTNVIVDPDEPLQFHDPTWHNTTVETEMLFILHWTVADGYDLARCYFTREGGSDLSSLEFAEIEAYNGECQLTPDTPGFNLMRRLLPA